MPELTDLLDWQVAAKDRRRAEAGVHVACVERVNQIEHSLGAVPRAQRENHVDDDTVAVNTSVLQYRNTVPEGLIGVSPP